MEKTTNALNTLQTEINTQIYASLGSLFTKHDVKNVVLHLFEKIFDIVNDVETTTKSTINLDVVNDAISNAIDCYDIKQRINIENARFSVDYSNCIEIDNYEIDFNTLHLINHIKDSVKEALETNVSV